MPESTCGSRMQWRRPCKQRPTQATAATTWPPYGTSYAPERRSPGDLRRHSRVHADDPREVGQRHGDVFHEVTGVRRDEHHAVAGVDGHVVDVGRIGGVV